jgi:hypothetical protein
MMSKQFLKDSFGWGLMLWFIGYIIGNVIFFVFPPALIGWVILPVGFIITLWVVLKKVKGDTLQYYVALAIVWTVTATVLDYLFIVKAFKPADGYYKLDVYLYYSLTFIIPLAIGWWKNQIQMKTMPKAP